MITTKNASRISLLLIIAPFLFLLGVILKHYLQVDAGLLTGFYTWVADLDTKYGDESVLNWIIRILLIGGPFAIVIVNLLAITKISLNRPQNELNLTIQLAWKSGLLLAAGSLILILFLGYLIAENLIR